MNKGMKLWRPLKTSPRFGQNQILPLPSKLKKPNFRFNKIDLKYHSKQESSKLSALESATAVTATVPSPWPDCGPARPAFQEVGGRGWTQSQPIQQRKQWSKCLVCWEWLLCHIKHALNNFISLPMTVTAMHISLFLQLTHHPFQSTPSTPTLWAARTGALHLAGYQTWNWMLPKQHLVFGSIHKFHKLEDPLSLFVMKSLDASGGALAGKASRGLDNQSLFPTIPFP